MCKKTNYKIPNPRIDNCMRNLIQVLNDLLKMANLPTKIVGCCCGHNKYPMTIICKGVNRNYELLTDATIPRTRNFYKRDKQGYYYIKEVNGDVDGKRKRINKGNN